MQCYFKPNRLALYMHVRVCSQNMSHNDLTLSLDEAPAAALDYSAAAFPVRLHLQRYDYIKGLCRTPQYELCAFPWKV